MSEHTVGRIVFSGHAANQALNRALSSAADAEIAALKAMNDRLMRENRILRETAEKWILQWNAGSVPSANAYQNLKDAIAATKEPLKQHDRHQTQGK